ncbi:uncharacterized protein PAC_05695 [Phialocephala subalpina]|uniref:Uncharacterized protein n=1 Tax=Phialocephala subalpina TaxID=576137 RepID=A0A1L7WSR7_9HELO|nr:uncharacterized protein PAC_05695 [Phialocephala subalpina]
MSYSRDLKQRILGRAGNDKDDECEALFRVVSMKMLSPHFESKTRLPFRQAQWRLPDLASDFPARAKPPHHFLRNENNKDINSIRGTQDLHSFRHVNSSTRQIRHRLFGINSVLVGRLFASEFAPTFQLGFQTEATSNSFAIFERLRLSSLLRSPNHASRESSRGQSSKAAFVSRNHPLPFIPLSEYVETISAAVSGAPPDAF